MAVQAAHTLFANITGLFPDGGGGIWKAVAVILVLLNLKNLPFFWHLRILNGLLKQLTLLRRRTRLSIGPEALFRPLIISTYSPLSECDYNLHKSNSTYFSDLDISRLHLISRLLDRVLTGAGGSEKNNNAEPQPRGPRHSIILGGVSCVFRREIKPYERYEVWSRVLSWDRKWIYVVSHFVRRGAVRPKGYILRDGGRKGGWLEFLRWKSSGKKTSPLTNQRGEKRPEQVPPNGTGPPMEPCNPAIYASALSKYVIKRGRLTIPPERILDASGLLPPKPPSASSSEQTSPAPKQQASPSPEEGEVTVDTLLQETLSPKEVAATEQESETQSWTWERVEEERQRGLTLAAVLAGMDSAHAAFTGAEEELALGEFGDLL